MKSSLVLRDMCVVTSATGTMYYLLHLGILFIVPEKLTHISADIVKTVKNQSDTLTIE